MQVTHVAQQLKRRAKDDARFASVLSAYRAAPDAGVSTADEALRALAAARRDAAGGADSASSDDEEEEEILIDSESSS